MPESSVEQLTAQPVHTAGAGVLEGRSTRRWTTIVGGVAATVLAVVMAVILVGGTQAPTALSLRAETASYQLRLDLDGASLGRRNATIQVTGAGGQPVAAADVEVSTAMPTMGMTGPLLHARQTAPGQYQASGELFTMLGDWTVSVRILESGSTVPQQAVFTVIAVP